MALHRRMGPVMPEPFKRKSISIGEKKRSWEMVPAYNIRVGSIVAEFGAVESFWINDTADIVVLTNVEGDKKRVGFNTLLLTFQ